MVISVCIRSLVGKTHMRSFGVDSGSLIRKHSQAVSAAVANMPIFRTPALTLRRGVGLFNEKVAYDDADSHRL